MQRLISDAIFTVLSYKTVHLSEDPCYTLGRSGLIESPYIPATRTRFVQPGKIEIDANERAVIGKRNAAFSFAPSSILSLTIYLPAEGKFNNSSCRSFGRCDRTVRVEAMGNPMHSRLRKG